jgi:hypothetical protein
VIWHRKAVASAWGLALLVTLASIVAWTTVVPGVPPDAGVAPGSWRREIVSPVATDTADIAAAAAQMRDRDPFRWERRPSDVRFNPWEPATTPISSLPAPPPRPALGLVGIVGGPSWIALVEGIPGREGGVVLRVGETTGGIRLDAVHGDTARLSGFDTTWVLTPRQAWH